MIDILVPVLARPHRAQPLIDNITANTTVPHRVLFLTTPGNMHQWDECVRTGADVLEVEAATAGGQYAIKINEGFRRTAAPYVLCAADDLEFTPEWDTVALGVAFASQAGVIGTNDMNNRHVMNGGFSTHPLVRRAYIMEHGGSLDGPGIVYHEGYDHNYPDRELACLAQYRGEWAFAIESKVIHRHPGFGRNADATYRKGHKRFREDHALFMERSAGWDHVGLVAGEKAWVARHRTMR